jgi:hypothetical protein
MDQAGLAQNGPVLIARSGSCLLMPIYAAFSKIGALIHLWRNEYLWDEQRSLIRDVFVRFPELSDRPTVGLVSSPKLRDENQLQLEQAHALILSLAPIARFVEILVGSEPQEHTDPELHDLEMSVELLIGTYCGKVVVDDDYGKLQEFDWSTVR